MPRRAIVPGLLLVLGVLWILDPRTIDGPPTTAVQQITPHSLSVVDGDTVKLAGQSIRLIGYDTPETYRAECEAEKAQGDLATDRLRELLREASSAQLAYLPNRDQYGRNLARLMLDGRDVADVLVGEGLARRYAGGQRQGWC